ncbi:MAG TPA: protein-L-isoaspartate(D-aspartate) O-methyltransferase [Flavipsychrobacter sp.]|nr:protein-L-isoaspartate(D-aspartate) O-methyltransferase [Flavipsychrobacter sp.]
MLHSKPKDDNYLHKGLRKQLIQALREKGIKDERVLAAIGTIPRHFFLDPAFERQSYEDRAFPISAGQTISQPYTVAYQTQLLEVKKFDKILEIGTGSAYQACVLAELGAMVFTIERQKALYDFVSQFFFLKNYPNIKRFFGDGYEGLPSFAPFDKVIVTAAAPLVPPKLVEQLKPGGIMIIPVGEEGGQKMLRITKDKEGKVTEEEMGDFVFVPMLTGKNNTQA